MPDPTTPANLLNECGRGLFLMRKLLDEVRYNDRGNSVTLILKAQQHAHSRFGGGAQA